MRCRSSSRRARRSAAVRRCSERRRQLSQHARPRARAHARAVRRLPHAAGRQARPVNVDTFPTALVRSVDVVTGGASAAYGADALGGVTNFILDREFEGLKFAAGTGMNEFDSEGKNWNVSVAGGTRNRRASQHHRLVRGAARRSGQPQPRRSRPELVPALGTRPESGLERESASGCLSAALDGALGRSAGLHVNGEDRAACLRPARCPTAVQRRRQRDRAVRHMGLLIADWRRGSPAAPTR